MVGEKKVRRKKGEEKAVKDDTETGDSVEAKEDEGKSHSKQTKIAVIIMIVLLVSVLLTHWAIQEIRKFEYDGIEFYKQKEDTEIFYMTQVLYYLPTGLATGEGIPIQFKLRNDPRELGEIPIEGEVKLKKEVILSLSPQIANCSDTIMTMIDFSIILKAFGISAEGATTDRRYGKENDIPFADCRKSDEKTVIMMKEGNETRITQEGGCYIVEIKDCKIQESYERFLFGFIKDSILRE